MLATRYLCLLVGTRILRKYIYVYNRDFKLTFFLVHLTSSHVSFSSICTLKLLGDEETNGAVETLSQFKRNRKVHIRSNGKIAILEINTQTD